MENYSDDPKISYIYLNGANFTKSSDALVQIGMKSIKTLKKFLIEKFPPKRL